MLPYAKVEGCMINQVLRNKLISKISGMNSFDRKMQGEAASLQRGNCWEKDISALAWLDWEDSQSSASRGGTDFPTCIVMSNINLIPAPAALSCHWRKESNFTTSYFPHTDRMLWSYIWSWFINTRWNTVESPTSLQFGIVLCPVWWIMTSKVWPLSLHRFSGGGISSGIFQGTHAISSSTPFNPAQQVSNLTWVRHLKSFHNRVQFLWKEKKSLLQRYSAHVMVV